MKKQKPIKFPHVEFFLVFAIAFCQIMMMAITNERMESFQDLRHYNEVRDALESGDYITTHLDDRVLNFYPNACKLVSIYDQDLDLKLRLIFRDTSEEDLISKHDAFRELVEQHETGYTSIVHDDGEVEDIFFVWVPDPNGYDGENLIVLRVIKPSESDVWMYNAIAYGTIFMVFALVIIMMLRRKRDSINHYYAITREKMHM